MTENGSERMANAYAPYAQNLIPGTRTLKTTCIG